MLANFTGCGKIISDGALLPRVPHPAWNYLKRVNALSIMMMIALSSSITVTRNTVARTQFIGGSSLAGWYFHPIR
jgi:hypothetical protein